MPDIFDQIWYVCCLWRWNETKPCWHDNLFQYAAHQALTEDNPVLVRALIGLDFESHTIGDSPAQARLIRDGLHAQRFASLPLAAAAKIRARW